MSHARDSFETLDLESLEASDELDDESGSRPLQADEAPRGVWSDAPPRPVIRSGVLPPPPPPGMLPPPLPRGFARAKMAPVPRPADVAPEKTALEPSVTTARSTAPEKTALEPSVTTARSAAPEKTALEPSVTTARSAAPELDVPEPPEPVTEVDRVDLDGLVRDLSTRPATPRTEAWELPSAPVTPRAIEARRSLETPERRVPAWAWGIGSIATYLLGLATPSLLGWTAPPPSDESASIEVAAQPVAPSAALEPTPSTDETAFAIEEPSADEAAAIEAEPIASAAHAPATRPRVARARAADVAREERGDAEQDEPPVEPAAHEPASAAPSIEVPSRDDVQQAMTSVQPTIEACATAADRGQLARVRFTFTSEGRPSHTIVSGVAGQTASCIARAARGVRLPTFARDTFIVEFPFQL